MGYIYLMRIKGLLPVLGIIALLLSSCNLILGNTGEPPVLDAALGQFWAQNFTNNSYYEVNADLLAVGANCNVWAEKGSGVDPTTAKSVADQYDTVILPEMLKTFSYDGTITYAGKTVNNIMALADLLGDRDGKLCILLLDIKDGYKKAGDPYTAGYFWSGNLLNISYSNRCDMIYIDSYPGQPGTQASNSTLAHEMQHLMNYVSSICFRKKLMDTWIDEGLSSAAEWLYYNGQYDVNRYNWYRDYRSLISSGNNFFVWGNHKQYQYAILDDYATVYLFFQWLRLQSGSTAIYKNIITSADYDFNAVTKAAASKMVGQGYEDWGTLLKTWLAASYINSESGKYGYMNDSVLGSSGSDPIKFSTTALASFSLAPGEAVYSIIPSGSTFTAPNPKTGNINYCNLTTTLSEGSSYTTGALLTVNVNSNNGGAAENGITTGTVANISTTESQGRSFMAEPPAWPSPIGAADILQRNGFAPPPEPGLPRLPIEILSHE